MVTRILAYALLMLFRVAALAQPGNADIEELPRSYKAAAIRTVIIKENQAWNKNVSSSQTPADCSGFILKERDVRDYFRYAKRIGRATYNYLPFSSCYASGDLIFKNGDHATWYIDSTRRGEFLLTNGRRAYFYGLNAHAKVFAQADPHFNDPSYDTQSKSEPKVRIGPIKSITIRPDMPKWGKSDDQRAGLCHFDLTESDVRDYFLHAKIVDAPTYVSGLPHSTCRLEGEIEFANGLRGIWLIESKRRGVLDLSNGGSAYLFSKDAQAKGFE